MNVEITITIKAQIEVDESEYDLEDGESPDILQVKEAESDNFSADPIDYLSNLWDSVVEEKIDVKEI